MKILHIVPTYFPAVRYGGPIHSVHALCRALAAAGHRVHVFTTSVDGPGDSNVPHGRSVDLDGVQVHYFRSRWLRRMYYSAELKEQLTLSAGVFDVLHLHSVFLFPTWAGATSAVRARVPYVLSPRGMLVRELINQRSAAAKRSWIRLVERRNLAHSARIHLTSGEERRALVDLGLALAPMSVIPNGVEMPVPFPSDAVSADVRALVAQGFDILSFGRITWKKGLDRLIRAMPQLSNASALIAGNDEDGLAAKLRGIAETSGVGDRVRFLPRQITGADKEALFAAARLFVLPSLSENFGNVVGEAMIRGVPVVVTERVGAAEIIEASGGGVVARACRGEFAAVLANLLQSDERLAAMSAAGANYAREQLTWHGIARRFDEMYWEISALSEATGRSSQFVTA
jgi:glycosyltransferase involved in cell wall biosynthesis